MKIRIIGCGVMGSALGKALSLHGHALSLYDQYPEAAEKLGKAIGAQVCRTLQEEIENEEMLILAVKPQDFERVSSELLNVREKLIVSILAGIDKSRLKAAFRDCYVLRMMPNLAVEYGEGIVALVEDADLATWKAKIEETFSPLGLVKWIPESLCNPITALAASGPAFVYLLIDAMRDAAVALGFNPETGFELVKQMVSGSLSTLNKSGETPAALVKRVASPNGTTMAGIRVFEEKDLRHGIVETFLAAYRRAEELNQK